MLRRILSVTMRDLKSGTRDFLVIYILIAPFLLALILSALIPSAGGATIHVAAEQSIEPDLIDHLSRYGRVEIYDDRSAVLKRVDRHDEVFGLLQSQDGYTIVERGDETQGKRAMLTYIVDAYVNRDLPQPVTVQVTDIGRSLSPLRHEGANLLLIFGSIFGGMLIVLSLVDEKMHNTISAIHVTAISKTEYVIGKALLGFLMPVVGSVGTLLILGFYAINYAMVLITIVGIALISVIIGFSVGVVNQEPISAIASMKAIFIPALGSIFGGMFLAQRWHVLLYWSPFYWAYDSVHAILSDQASWTQVFMNLLIILAITALVFIGLRKRILRGLN